MIFFFFGATSTSGPVAFQQMSASAQSFLNKKKGNFNPVQIESQTPFWLKKNTLGQKTRSGMLDFLQGYYDWLTNGYGLTGVNVMDLANLADISNTPEVVLPYFINSYAPDIKGVYDLPEEMMPSADNIRQTIDNIKVEIYQRKSNEDAYKSLLASLFGKDPNEITFWYPKRKLMRLNAGKLDSIADNDYYGKTGEYSPNRYTIIGSNLNQGVLQNGKMWQEFSYIITTSAEPTIPYYQAVINETLHPAGLLGIFETKEVYSEGGYGSFVPPVEEIPQVSNYYVYNLQSSQTLPRCSGCTGAMSKIGWYFPTFVYPTWDNEISISSATDFGSIRIEDFLKLTSSTGSPSPNEIIGTSCIATCGTSGSAQFSWEVIRNYIRYPGVTGISANEQIIFTNNSTFGFTRYLWNFGDGATSNAAEPSHGYTLAGIYGVTLTAIKDDISYQSVTGGVKFYVN